MRGVNMKEERAKIELSRSELQRSTRQLLIVGTTALTQELRRFWQQAYCAVLSSGEHISNAGYVADCALSDYMDRI